MKTAKKKVVKNKFMPTKNPFVKAMEVESNYTLTENGAKTNKSTMSNVLDWFGAGGALRQRTPSDVIALFSRAFSEDPLSALKILFYFRDVREGQGERQSFRTILNHLGNTQPDLVRKNIENVPFFGRYDDLYSLVGTPVEGDVFSFFKNQLKIDLKNMKKGEPVSLLGKWLASENTSSKETRAFGYKTRNAFDMDSKKYRKTLSALRKHIDVIECKMCSNNWSEIDFEKVPSKASLNYRKAFGRHDQTRYANYLNSVEKGEAKINAGTLYPYELIRTLENYAITDQEKKSIDLQWKAMPNWVNEGIKGITISDTSGSMSGLPLLVSISLGIYFAERNVGPFKNCWMNFSNNPTFQKLKGETLYEKLKNMDRDNWHQSTNLQAAFDLILNTGVSNKIKQKDMPELLIIISDMEFNVGCSSNDKTNFEVAKQKFAVAGYKMPQVIWWNVNARNDQFPIRVDDTGTALVSGCSPSIFKSVMSGKKYDPMSMVYDTIGKERYNKIIV